MKHRLARASALALFILASVTGSAFADDVPSSELRRRGDEAMDARRAAEALELYRRAAALEPAPALDDNIGRALLATGDVAGALARPANARVTIDHPRRLALRLANGEIRRVDITLDREAKKSPWFWAGIAVLVAGAVVTTVALTQTRSPDDGSLGTFHAP